MVDAGTVESEGGEPDDHGDGWKFNLVMVLVAMFFGMMLTNWGVVQVSKLARYEHVSDLAISMRAAIMCF